MQTYNIEVDLINMDIVNFYVEQAIKEEKAKWFNVGGFIAHYSDGTILSFVFPKPDKDGPIKIAGTNGYIISKITRASRFCNKNQDEKKAKEDLIGTEIVLMLWINERDQKVVEIKENMASNKNIDATIISKYMPEEWNELAKKLGYKTMDDLFCIYDSKYNLSGRQRFKFKIKN